MTQKESRILFLALIVLLMIAVVFFLPPIPQPLEYHDFADQKMRFGIAFANDVISNLPLLLIGIWGTVFAIRHRFNSTSNEERHLWMIFFSAAALSAIFSIYYHLHPNHFRLAIERLGLSVLFTSFFSLMLFERLGKKLGLLLTPLLLFLGILSVIYWSATESSGIGDVRFYAFVQFVPILLLLPLFYFFPSSLPGRRFLYLGILCYGFAKLCEIKDQKIFALLGIISGHTLKHLFASATVLFLIFYLGRRKKMTMRKF